MTRDFEKPSPGNAGEVPQLWHLSKFINTVTLTVGGNDMGFPDLAQACVIGIAKDGTPGDCAVQAGLAQAQGTNPAADTFDKIWTTVSPFKNLYDGLKQSAAGCSASLADPIAAIVCAYALHKTINAFDEAIHFDPERQAATSFLWDGTLVSRLKRIYS